MSRQCVGRSARSTPYSCLAILLLLSVTTSPAAAPESVFIYHAQARDTLIGLGRRLLIEPQRWHEVQTLNHILDPRRIPRGALLRIPYEWLRTAREDAMVATLSGSVTETGSAVTPGKVLSPGSVISTGPDGSVTLNLADGSVVTLQKSSSLTLDEMNRISGVEAAHSVRLKLNSGRIETTVKPHRDVGRFEISTPVAVSAVRGTQFRDSFSAEEDRATSETLEGTVAVAGATASVSVAAGFGTRVDREQPPLQPVLLLPPPELLNLPRENTGELLRVEWHPVVGAKAYRIQVSTDPEFHALESDTVTTEPVANIAALPDNNYWLRVRAIDALELEGADAVRQIRQHVLPGAPSPTAPRAAAKFEGTQAQFAWTSASAGLRYTLQVAKDPEFTEIISERERLDTPSASVEDLSPGVYFWRVATVNAQNERGAWSNELSFTQRPAMPMPEVPHQVAKRLLLRWQAFPGQRYRVQIARDAQFKRTIREQELDESEWATPKLSPGTYFVHVQLIDPDGNPDPFGPPRRFVIEVPLWVKIVAPLALLLPLVL